MHKYLVKDIAFQAGLSTATVDRVLNGRQGASPRAVLRVGAAIRELERQEANLARGGGTLAIDVVMETPDRFSREVRTAFEENAGFLYPTMFRPRFHLAERIEQAVLARHLDRIRTRGSDGVVIKAPDVPAVRDAVARLALKGIPVITLVTDLPGSGRIAYAGIDNNAAGNTAAYLMALALGGKGAVLSTASSNRFRGEEQRLTAFAGAISAAAPNISIVTISEGFGRDESTGPLAIAALCANAAISAVYSAGGANRSILDAFARSGRQCRAFIAHDLDADNRQLLRERKIDFVLDHDIASDVRSVYRILLARARGAQPAETLFSRIEVITPFNLTD